MIQPTGRVCGFHPSVRTYVRSSPIVCIADSICTVTRLFSYIFYYKLSFKKACQLTLRRNRDGRREGRPRKQGQSDSWSSTRAEDSGDRTYFEEGYLEATGEATLNPGNVTGNTQQESLAGLLTFEESIAARVLSFIFMAFPQWLKIVACSGTPWTSTWASFYFCPFVITECISFTAGRIEEKEEIDLDWIHIGRISLNLEDRLDTWERGLGFLAVSTQLVVIMVLERIISPEGMALPLWTWLSAKTSQYCMIFISYSDYRTTYSFITLSVLLNLILRLSQNRKPSGPNLNMISTQKPTIEARWANTGSKVFIPFLISCTVLFTAALILLPIYGFHGMANMLWPHVMFWREPIGDDGESELAQRQECSRNAKAFIFMASVVYFGAYQYWFNYDPGDTRKPEWVEIFG
ncbi:hypothetical protein TWF506_007782 [Arthrobotrys conoides]|uniref:Uncharacterized protein n=1 Tax=Arthrobotrys conoides TaxID=74498 RepID=A0AAN8NQF1_9PEZI